MPNFKKIVLDTNFLMIPCQFGVDIFQELSLRLDFPYKLYIVSGTITELESIIEKDKNKFKIAAKIGLELIKTKSINIINIEHDKFVDDVLVELSKDPDYIIATQDKELKQRIKNKIIILKQKKYIELVS